MNGAKSYSEVTRALSQKSCTKWKALEKKMGAKKLLAIEKNLFFLDQEV